MNDKKTLLTEMYHEATVITPNNRLATQLLRDYSQLFISANFAAKKPICIPYTNYLQISYNHIQHNFSDIPHPILLTKQQQTYLWKTILERSGYNSINIGLLNQIQDAWRRCKFWLVDISRDEFQQTSQTTQFQIWAKQFQNELSKLNAITNEQLVEYIIQNNFLNIPNKSNKIIWVAFDEYTPEQQALQNHLTGIGYTNHHYDNNKAQATVLKYVAKDKQSELNQILAFVKKRLIKSQGQIAIIIPNLADEEKVIKRLLDKHLPEQYNISLGKSLCEFPLISHALQWLQVSDEITNHQAKLILKSPYITSSKTEFKARSDILQNSHLLTKSTISLSSLQAQCQIKSPKLGAALLNVTQYPESAQIDNWIIFFKKRLETLGFPGEYTLSSASYQSFSRLMALFDEFQELAFINPFMTKEEALNNFLNLAKNSIFQLQQPSTQVVVLGLLEASGCAFDSIWMCNLNDKCLPNNTNFSAFIPISLQKELSMPHASTAREFEFARKQLQRLQNSASEIIFSYASFIDDIPMLACPLINHFPNYLPETISHQNNIHLTPYEEKYRIPLENLNVKGGTYLLASQAKCPFKAFAEHRLHADYPEEITEGPNALERGRIIHKIMEEIWLQLESQKKLLSIDTNELDNLIEQIILKNIASIGSYDDKQDTIARPLENIVKTVELARLKRLVMNALAWEMQREEFKVTSVEQKFQIELAGITFQVRVDRIDTIKQTEPTPKKIVIDYKSSLPISKPWNEDRPEEPQLLLYSLLDTSINTLIFMELKAGNIKISGFSAEKSLKKGITSVQKDMSWELHRDYWQQQLHDLATEFKSGICAPKPNKKSTCSQCNYQDLCRI